METCKGCGGEPIDSLMLYVTRLSELLPRAARQEACACARSTSIVVCLHARDCEKAVQCRASTAQQATHAARSSRSRLERDEEPRSMTM